MEMRKLGRFEVSVVGLGCNNFGMRIDEKQTAKVVGAALDAGINFFDTADIYGATKSEEFLGKALASRRDDVVVATKFGAQLPDVEDSGGASRRWITRAIEDSLRRLGTDRIDLYQLHVPAGDVPIDETLEALTDLVTQGKVLEIGCSNFSGDQIDESFAKSSSKGWSSWVSAQNHYSLLQRGVEAEVLPACERIGLGMLPYFPLASGLLTGKYSRGQAPSKDTRLGAMAERNAHWLTDANFDIVENLEKFVSDRGRTLLELAFSWLAARPAVVSVIAGATKPEQVKANADAITWNLTTEDLEATDRITLPR